jgi:hypothetical protein
MTVIKLVSIDSGLPNNLGISIMSKRCVILVYVYVTLARSEHARSMTLSPYAQQSH